MILYEYTKKSLINNSKKGGSLSRFSRRSEIGDNWSLYRVGLLELDLTDDLCIFFKVNSYKVSLRILKFNPLLFKYVGGKYKNTKTKAIEKAIRWGLRYNHIQVACDCPDFRYRFAYMATQKGYGFNTVEGRPANIRNPKNKGGICKHIVKILNVPSKWIPRVATQVRGYLDNKDKNGTSIVENTYN